MRLLNKLENKLRSLIRSMAAAAAYDVLIDQRRDLFAIMGIADMRKILDKAESEDRKYVYIAEMFNQIMQERYASKKEFVS